MGRRPHLVPSLISAALLFGALGDHPYSYFTVLRWVVCISAAMVAFIGTEAVRPLVPVPFIFLAFLFNPVIPVFMSREAWLPVDLIAAVMFLYAATIVRPVQTPGAQGPVSRPPEPVAGAKPPPPAELVRVPGVVGPLEQLPPDTAPAPEIEDDLTSAAVSPEALLALGRRLWRERPAPDIEGARAAFMRAAACGSVEALNDLGSMLEYYADPPDLAGARSAYERAADLGDIAAMTSLVELLIDLNPPDTDEARRWAEQAAAAGDAGGLFRMSVMLLTKPDPPDTEGARRMLERAADLGDTNAMVVLVHLLIDSEPPDIDPARTWAEQAAASGDAAGLVRLGTFRLQDEAPDPVEIDEARSLFERACKMDDADGYYNLGCLLYHHTSPPDTDGARAAWERAVDLNEISDAAEDRADAMVSLVHLLTGTNPPELDDARIWAERASAVGEPAGLSHLGLFLSRDADPPDLDGARSAYEAAAAAGDRSAMVSLVHLLLDLEPPDLDGAREWAERAAAAGATWGLEVVGAVLEGHADARYRGEARSAYEQAAELGDSSCMIGLVRLLLELDPPEVSLARMWAERAADVGSAQFGSAGGLVRLGRFLWEVADPPDIDEARRLFERACDMDDPEGCYHLGCLLYDHQSPPDTAGARAAWERAAVDGHYPRAMQRLGAWFEEAKPPDMESANHWYEQARHRWALYVSLGFVGEGESLE